MKRMNFQARKEQRRAAAVERQAYYDSLSVAQRIEVAKSRRGESKKELEKL